MYLLAPVKIDKSANRVAVVEGNLDRYLESAEPAARRLDAAEPVRPGTSLSARQAVQLFEDMAASRLLDVAARELKRDGLSYYTISSAGHEKNAVVGALLREDDPCFLHYRSGGLMMARARRVGGETPVFDTLLSLTASKDDPASGGRHKVWGSRRLWVPPQTSTIASHLPKAVGAAFALSRARRMGVELPVSGDAIVCCSFGDASASHATALAGINSARYAFRGGRPTPVLFVCEDNRIGISVDTPSGWIRDRFSTMTNISYFDAAGAIDEVWDTVEAAIRHCRVTRGPVFLRLDCVRLWGHAGSDIETAYRSWEEICSIEAQDPLLVTARRLVELGVATPTELREILADTAARVRAGAREAAARPKLTTRAEIMAPLAPFDEDAVRAEVAQPVDPARRAVIFDGALPEEADSPQRKTLAAHLNAALCDELARRPEVMLFGEDVGKKGGVYGVTHSLQKRLGRARVFDTLLDETTILGVAQGAAQLGLLPIPEIQYLAYVHNAVDQLRGEACSLSFFSDGQFQNPMVVRIAGLAYQKGFGGHFHNDDSIGGLRDIPGLMIVTPARGDDGVRLLRGALATAKACGRVVVFLEPIALYHERDLYADGDKGWLFDYPGPGRGSSDALLPGEVGVYHADARDLVIFSYANGLRLSLRAARRLELEHGVRARVVDLRWLLPLPFEAIERHAAECGAVLVADECRRTGGGIAAELVAHLAERGYAGRLASACAADTYVPLGPAADVVLLSEDDIVQRALEVRA
ncbi:MAG: MFS transporter [Planctomycetes bacterium]|nr:MFS transporter [Planctomycetota bacterium]